MTSLSDHTIHILPSILSWLGITSLKNASLVSRDFYKAAQRTVNYERKFLMHVSDNETKFAFTDDEERIIELNQYCTKNIDSILMSLSYSDFVPNALFRKQVSTFANLSTVTYLGLAAETYNNVYSVMLKNFPHLKSVFIINECFMQIENFDVELLDVSHALTTRPYTIQAKTLIATAEQVLQLNITVDALRIVSMCYTKEFLLQILRRIQARNEEKVKIKHVMIYVMKEVCPTIEQMQELLPPSIEFYGSIEAEAPFLTYTAQ